MYFTESIYINVKIGKLKTIAGKAYMYVQYSKEKIEAVGAENSRIVVTFGDREGEMYAYSGKRRFKAETVPASRLGHCKSPLLLLPFTILKLCYIFHVHFICMLYLTMF